MVETFLSESMMVLKLLLSLLLGGLIGWQREYTGQEAGIRTFAFIALGSCIFGILSVEIFFPGDPGRIAAQVVSGIGFMGVGMIIRDGADIRGLTTAATLWCAAAIGLSIAYNYFAMGIFSAVLILGLLFLPSTPFWKVITGKKE